MDREYILKLKKMADVSELFLHKDNPDHDYDSHKPPFKDFDEDGRGQTLHALIDLALKGLDEWQSIETAPKDGTPVILYDPEKRFGTDVLEGYYDDGLWLIPDRGFVNATRWKPLPTPPKEGH